MASAAAPSMSASDGSPSAGRAWNRPSGGRFEWVASSPSSTEIAELERLFPEIIQAPAQALENEVAGWENCSIIARSLGRWVPPEAIVREFHRSGIAGEIAAFSLAHRHYIFRFAEPHAKDLVLGRPLVVNGQLIATMEWQSEFVPSVVTLLSALVWIRLPLLPLEFWHEEILSKILSVAGEFCFVDDATRLKSRGGFARACVRVDLGKPLRPGARVRGSRSPFWQQFSFESLDGICVSCGAVHFVDRCDPVAKPDASSVGPRFGPWMAAIRRRRPTQLQPPEPSPSALREGRFSSAAKEGRKAPLSVVECSGPASSPVSKDGWTIPKKLARRQHPPSSASLLLLPGQRAGRGETEGSGSSELQARESCMQVQAAGKALVPVPIGLGQGLQDDPRRLRSVPVGTVAPFQLVTKEAVPTFSLGSECQLPECGEASRVPKLCLGFGSGSLPLSRDTVSGPSKRARPVETLSNRMPSRSLKGKGKASLKNKIGDQAAFTFEASSVACPGSEALSARGAKKARGRVGAALGVGSDSPNPIPLKSCSHVSAVIQLKQAIQSTDSAVLMDSVLTDDRGDTGPLGGSEVLSGATEAPMESVQAADCRDKGYRECSEEMSGVLVGALPNPASL